MLYDDVIIIGDAAGDMSSITQQDFVNYPTILVTKFYHFRDAKSSLTPSVFSNCFKPYVEITFT